MSDIDSEVHIYLEITVQCSLSDTISPNHDDYSYSVFEIHAYKYRHEQTEVNITDVMIVHGYVYVSQTPDFLLFSKEYSGDLMLIKCIYVQKWLDHVDLFCAWWCLELSVSNIEQGT